jgi:DNA-binding transcriptional LysR family regulator
MISNTNKWAQIELRHLIALQAIAETGSFGRGALLVGYTQSAISQQIAALEAILDERLIERSRGPRPIQLTEPGRVLLRHAEAIVAHLHAAQADIAAYQAGEMGVLRVGTYQSVGTHLLPLVVRSFAAAWPQVEIRLTEATGDEPLLASVASGDLDLAFTTIPLLDGPFASVELLTDPWVLLLAADAPLAESARANGMVELSELKDYPLIGFRQCRATAEFEAYLAEHGVSLRTIFRSEDNGTVQGLVAAGMGAALMPRLAIEPDANLVVSAARARGTDIPPRIIGLTWHRDRYRSPAAYAFVEAARQGAAALASVRGDGIRYIESPTSSDATDGDEQVAAVAVQAL